MKKYRIKNADGSDCREINSYESRNEASDALMKYLYSHNEYLSVNDDNYLSPFDFKIEEVDIKDVNDTITDFESARETLGLKPNVAYIPKSGDVKRLVTDINPKHIKALVALNKLFTIAQAWNKEDEFVPNYSDWKQAKWFPWFKYDEDTARFVCVDTIYTPTNLFAYFGFRLCFKTSERAEQFGKQFDDLYNMAFYKY